MNEIYWLTRLDAINVFLGITIGILAVLIIIYLIRYFDDFDDFDSLKFIKKLSIYLFITVLLFIFTPTTNQAYMICGIGGTIDYIKNDSIATKIPHKVIVALDKYIDSITNE